MPSPPKTGKSETEPLAGGKGEFTELACCLGEASPLWESFLLNQQLELPTGTVK